MEHACVHVLVCSASDARKRGLHKVARLSELGVCIFDAILHNGVPEPVWIYTVKCLVPPRRTALCWQWYTVGFLRATGGGWVHTVNYTSHPLVWFIALITVGSLKKEKGEEAYKIKKKTESAIVTERERERIVCECTWRLLVCTRAALFTAVNYSEAHALSLQ